MNRRKRSDFFHLVAIVFVILVLLIGGALAFRLSAHHTLVMVVLVGASIAVGAALCSWTIARPVRGNKRY